MSEEEKKQVQIINNFMLYCRGFENKKYSDTELFIALEDVSDLIQKQQEEIEKLKIDKQEAWNEWNDLEQGSYEEENKLKAKIEKKDKIIDEMLQEFTDCEFEFKCSSCCIECEKDYDQLYECNKQYFEKKVEGK